MIAIQELIDPQPITQPISDAPWFVVLTQPQQDITTVWRLHELGLEMYVPVLRNRVKTGRVGRNGLRTTRVIAKPMFPGYGFLRMTDDDVDSVKATRGVRDFMRNERNQFVTLPHVAVRAVFRKQMEEHQAWLQEARTRGTSHWKRGDHVRVDQDGGAYAGLIATVDKIDSKGRIQVLLGMIRHTLPADMVVAA